MAALGLFADGLGLLAQGDSLTGAASGAASGAAAAAGNGGGSPPGAAFMQILMFVGIFAVFYFLVLRPQQKRAKEHKSFVEQLKVGARVVTASGLFGKITALEGHEAKLEIADKVVVRVLKSQIAGLEGNAAEAVAQANPK